MNSLVKNSFYNVVYRCINVLYPLITAAYVSRILFSEGIGKISSAQNISQYFVIIAALGIPTYGIRAIAKVKKRQCLLNKVFTELIIINCISTMICVIVYYTLVIVTNGFGQDIKLSIIMGCSIILNFFNVDWFYQGKEEYKYILKRNIFVKLISLVLVFTLIQSKDDYLYYAVILVLGVGMNNIFNIFNLKRYVHIELKGLNFAQHLRAVITLFSASIAIEVYTLADTTMLTYLCNENIVGYYTNAVKSISAIKTLMISVCAVFLPRLTLYLSEGSKKDFENLVSMGLKIITYISIPAAIGMILLSHKIIPILYGAEFMPSVKTTIILSASIVTVSLSNFIGYQILVSLEKESIILLSTSLGAILNVILNFFLIRNFQQNGAAIASVITEAIITLIQLYYLNKLINIQIDNKFKKTLVITNVIMVLIVLICTNLLNYFDTPINIFFSVSIGIISYFLVGLLLKNEITLKIKDFILIKTRRR